MARIDIDRARAMYALQCVENKVGNYGSYIESLPMMLHNSGLRNTLAFAYANGYLKGKRDWEKVFIDIVYWFVNDTEYSGLLKHKFAPQFKELDNNKIKADAALKIMLELEDEEYRAVTQEIYALLNWLRKLVKGDKN